MHDPHSVAFEIKNPFAKKEGGYRPNLITIWHCDPETDGTDDSCGMFIRARHVDQEMLKKVRREFTYNWNYWFNELGMPTFSVIGTVVEMYKVAAWQIFKHDRKRSDKFFRKHLHEIISFAENPIDSLNDSIIQKWGEEKKEERVERFTSIIIADIYRKKRKWYQYPRWHIHHWKIQFHPFQRLKRRYWDKCSACGKRGFKGSAHSDWGGTRIWHSECEATLNAKVEDKAIDLYY